MRRRRNTVNVDLSPFELALTNLSGPVSGRTICGGTQRRAFCRVASSTMGDSSRLDAENAWQAGTRTASSNSASDSVKVRESSQARRRFRWSSPMFLRGVGRVSNRTMAAAKRTQAIARHMASSSKSSSPDEPAGEVCRVSLVHSSPWLTTSLSISP